MPESVTQEKTAKYFLIDEMTIIVAEKQEQAENFYRSHYDDDWGNCEEWKIEEIQDNFIVDAHQCVSGEGYIEVHLSEVLESKALPYVVDVELI